MNSKRLVILLTAAASILTISCTGQTTEPGKAGSPTEGFKALYAAVKSGKTEDIKKTMSKATLNFAEGIGAQQNKSLSEMLKNGFTRTTFADKLPAIRDERVKDKMGAVEVYNAKDKVWEDLPFVLEDGSWKLAVGDKFLNRWTSPGPSQTVREGTNSNAAGGQKIVPYGNQNSNANFNENVVPIVPKRGPGPAPPAANNK